MSQDTAVAATLLIRFATLWFGVGIGLVSLLVMQRRIQSAESRVQSPESKVPSPKSF